LVLRALIATPVFCASFAAYCGSLEPSALIKEPQAGCDEKAPFPSADEQQADQTIACEPQGPTAEQDDRSYLVETASPGSTMMRQGPEVAIERLNPQFIARLASAIREARESGLPCAGIFSAYRPPAFGVGGFLDKFCGTGLPDGWRWMLFRLRAAPAGRFEGDVGDLGWRVPDTAQNRK
jgi:hypothetical protein